MDSKWIKLIVLLGIADVVLCGTCPTWTSGRCLSDTSTLVTYDEAVAACEELCAHLVVLNDTSTYNGATLLLAGEAADQKAWIGLKHDAGQNAYLWLDGSALYSAVHWQAGSPSSNSGCRAAYHEFVNFLTHGFKDDACNATHRYFCERNTGTNCSYVKIPGASFTITNSGLHSCNEGNNCCSVNASLSYSCNTPGFLLSGFGGDAVCQSNGSYDVDPSAGSCVGHSGHMICIVKTGHRNMPKVQSFGPPYSRAFGVLDLQSIGPSAYWTVTVKAELDSNMRIAYLSSTYRLTNICDCYSILCFTIGWQGFCDVMYFL